MQMFLSQTLNMIGTSEVMLRDVTDRDNPVVQHMSVMNARKLNDCMINNRGIYQYNMCTTLITYERKGE